MFFQLHLNNKNLYICLLIIKRKNNSFKKILIMKKIITLFLAILFVVSSFGQKKSTSIYSESIDLDIPNNFALASDSKYDSTFFKFNYSFALDSMMGYIGNINTGYIWPDSTIILPDGSANSIFGIATSLDPKSPVFNGIYKLCSENFSKSSVVYLMSSIGLYCFYDRVPSLSYSVDTLIVQLKFGKNEQYGYFGQTNPWVISEFGTDTLWFNRIAHDSSSLISSRPDYYTFKFPLDSNSVNDTLPNGANYFKLPLNVILPHNYLNPSYPFDYESIAITFKPGFSWNPNADSIKNVNRIRFISTEQNGGGVGIGSTPDYTKGDYNCSFILHKDAYYQTGNYSQFFPTVIPDSLYSPSYAFKSEFPFENHWIDFEICRVIIGGFDEEISFNEMKIFPNPANNIINIQLNSNSGTKFQLKAFDIQGRTVMNTEIDNLNNISIAKLKKGFYLVVIEDPDGNYYKQKLVVD